MPKRLIIPEPVARQIEEILSRDRRNVEQILFLEGILADDAAIAISVTVPDANLYPGRYSVTPEAISECAQHPLSLGLRRVAQLHTHPGPGVDHSNYDDANAYSFIDGAISIVVPFYGTRGFDPKFCGVHLCENGRWNRTYEPQLHVQIAPILKDYRKCTKKSLTATKTRSRGFLQLILNVLRVKSQ